MKMKKNIALIYGGNSSEWQISIQSGKFVASHIDKDRYNVYEVLLRGASWSVGGTEIDKTDFSLTVGGEKIRFDMAFILIHGTPGENGLLQGYLEMLGVPFNTCSAFVSALTFDKHSCKRFLDFAGVKMAKDLFLRRGSEYTPAEIVRDLGLPLFVKPSNGGSSFGVTKVKHEDELAAALEEAFKECDSVLIEEALRGRELTNGIYCEGGRLITLPVTEIITEREFFDYDAKYLGESNEVCPAEIPETLSEKVREITAFIYNYLGCKGLVRMDYILNGEDIYFLEINTVPGMTPMSLVPGQVRAAGIDLQQFFTTLIEESL